MTLPRFHWVDRVVQRFAVFVCLCAFAPSALAQQPTAAPAAVFDPHLKSLVQLADALSRGELTSRELVRFYTARIRAYNQRGPEIHAITELDPSAVEQAAAADARRRARRTRSPLDGLPIVVKDNIDVSGLSTDAGSIALSFNGPREDSVAVAKLRAAGMIVLGKTNMSELAASYGRLGYSSAGGLTLNPVDLRRNASGSSSGSAAAVAADFAPAALGTDTSGSIRGPASAVGAVGVRATLGSVSTQGVVPLSSHFDVLGPITRDTADAALLLSVLTGEELAPIVDSVDGLRIGVVSQFSAANADVASVLEASADKLRDLGAVITPVTLSDSAAYAWTPLVGPLGEQDFVHDIELYLSRTNRWTPKSVTRIIDILRAPWVQSSANPPNPARVAGLEDAVTAADVWGGDDYHRLEREVRPSLQNEIRELFAREQLAAILYPTMECPASPRFDEPDPTWICDSDDEYAPSYLAPALGFPEVTVPAGLDREKLPIGMSLLGLPHTEPLLLQAASTLQHATDVHAATPDTPAL
jgi:amidase